MIIYIDINGFYMKNSIIYIGHFKEQTYNGLYLKDWNKDLLANIQTERKSMR